MLFAQPFPTEAAASSESVPPPVSDWIKSIRLSPERMGERLRRLLPRRRALR